MVVKTGQYYLNELVSLAHYSLSSLAFFERTRARYLQLVAADNRIKTIDASQSVQQVSESIKTILNEWLSKQDNII